MQTCQTFKMSEDVFPGGGEGVARLFYVDGKLYQIILIGEKGAYSAEEIDMFLDSFQLLP